MKFSPILLPFLPLVALANPIAEPNPGLESRADQWCNLHPTVDENVHCRASATSKSDHVRWITTSERFGVRCKTNGEVIFGNRVWDYIPGWGCWVTAHYTSNGCEDNVPTC